MTLGQRPGHTRVVARHLFIVDRAQPELFSYLCREFSAEPGVTVILDRRQGERRADGPPGASSERRRTDGRIEAEIRGQLATLGYAFVRLSCEGLEENTSCQPAV